MGATHYSPGVLSGSYSPGVLSVSYSPGVLSGSITHREVGIGSHVGSVAGVGREC